MIDDEPIGLRGPGGLTTRWKHVEPMFVEMTRAQAAGGPTASEPAARRIYEETLVDDVDAFGLDIRARALSNLAAIAETKGDLDEAISLANEVVELCLAVEAQLGSVRRTGDVRIGTIINRAQTYALVGRDTEGIADLSAAGAEFDENTPPLLICNLHNTLGNAYLSIEQYEQAAAEFMIARDVALNHEPRLASYAYSGLASVAHRTGDRRLAHEQMSLARELQATDAASAARADENLARMLLEQGDVDGAEAHFAAAERGYVQGGDPRGAAGCSYGRAAVLLARGKLLPARKTAKRALAGFTDQGDLIAQVSTHLLLGDINASAMRFADADGCYLRAREVCEAQGTMHEVARIDVRRAAVAHGAAGVAIRRSEKQRCLEGALNLALPAALATDAMRQRFAPGPIRERWVTGVASVALSIALQVITSLQHTRLAVELLEFVCSSASVDAGAVTADMANLPVLAQTDSPFDTEYTQVATAAGGTAVDIAMLGGSAPGAPALAPRVRAVPDAGDEFLVWISEAERRYRLAIRSSDLINAW
ncbi:tetratricopeptide repeat protein [Nocardia callitridis]|uniref:Tetratricopeptide repeat protein n=1 Tax=Nocardia callitridis TaxID=648753 RepID=A0ABP9K3Q0_9NOCA